MGAVAAVAYRTVYTFGERTYERTGDRTSALRYKRELMGPAIQTGVVKLGLGQINGVEIRVEPVDEREHGLDFTLRLSW
jgi:uncharacterized protein (TIGR02265 family)